MPGRTRKAFTPVRPSAVRQQGFTLVELLVVVAIIALLAGILVPTFRRGIDLAYRARCQGNLKEIARACKSYARMDRNHRGSTKDAMPNVGVTGSNWSDPAAGNRGCMWLLVEYGYASTGTFYCPALKEYVEAKKSDGQFKPNTCGYSFVSMIGRTLTTLTLDSSTILAGDKNPCYYYEGNSFRTRAGMEHENSMSHGKRNGKYEGQNVSFLDESVEWKTEPKVWFASQDDWIYHDGDLGLDGDPTTDPKGVIETYLIP